MKLNLQDTSERHQGKWRLLLFLMLLICLYAGLRPNPIPQLFRNFDLVLHFAACAGVAYVTVFAFRPPLRHWIIAALFIAAIFIEMAQGALLSRRAASTADFFAGIAGIPIGWWLAREVRRRLRRWCKQKSWQVPRTRNHW
ncbi:hypothetical protein [Microbulbifer agarilyticus]|nr:hypothetical protein [Microbulbifer agarilyticus]